MKLRARLCSPKQQAADRNDPDAGGTQLPPELANARVRRAKLLAAKAQIEARRQQALDAGRQDGPHSVRRTSKASSVSEPQSRMLRTAGDGSVQGYNAQVAADAGQSGLIVGQHLSDETTDYGLVGDGDGVASVVVEAGQPTVVLVDKGYENSELIARVEETRWLTILCPLRRRPHATGAPSASGAVKGRASLCLAL